VDTAIDLGPLQLNDVDPFTASLPSATSTFANIGHSISAQTLLNPQDMSGYYPPPGHSIPPQYYNIDPNAIPNPNIQHAPPTIISHGSYAPTLPDNPFQPGVPGPFVQYTENLIQPNYVDQYEDVSGPMGSAHGGNARARRRPAPGEQVKHRRTRSGCFTCRQRRVKVLAVPLRSKTGLTCNSATKIIPSARVSTCS
jgi:hypothetical protein